MSVIDSIFSKFNFVRKPQNFSQTQTPNADVPRGRNASIPITTTTYNELKELLTGYSQICINKRSQLFSNKEIFVGTLNSEGEYEYTQETNWLKELIANPNGQGITFKNLLKLNQQWSDIEGNAFYWFRQTGGGLKSKYPIEIIVIPAREVTINARALNFVESYSFMYLDQYITVPADEMCHVKTMNVTYTADSNTYYYKGVSIYVQALRTALKSYFNLMQYADVELGRMGILPLALHGTSDARKVEQIELDDYINTFKHVYKEYAPIVVGVDHGLELRNLGKETSILSQNTGVFAGGLNVELKELICNTFGFSLAKIENKIVGQANVASYDYILHTEVIDPMTQDHLDQINAHIQKIDKTVKICFNKYQHIDPEQKMRGLELLASYEAIDKNELRISQGYEPLDIYDTENLTDTEEVEEPETEEVETKNFTLKKKVMI